MFSVEQLVAHGVGDYILQSDKMALKKRDSKLWCLFHAFTYTMPFLFLTINPFSLFMIFFSHFLIDHYGLARYVVFAKNKMTDFTLKWQDCSKTGYPEKMPAFLSLWLLIIVDNILHVLCNGIFIYLGS